MNRPDFARLMEGLKGRLSKNVALKLNKPGNFDGV
jgi:hypothetical protein